MREFDVGIVGAGPAGLFAAVEIVKNLGSRAKVVLFDKGSYVERRLCPLTVKSSRNALNKVTRCLECRVCHIMHGVGGAGALSSGIINLRPDVGGDLDKLLGDWLEAENLIKYVNDLFTLFGAPENNLYIPDEKKVTELERLAAKAGAKYVPTPQRVLGTEVVVSVTNNITKYLEGMGVKFAVETSVEDVSKVDGGFKLTTDKGEYLVKRVLLAPGRGGAKWFQNVAMKLGLGIEPGPLDIGVRVEVPYYVTEHVTKVNPDPKIVMYTKSYDDKVRTFCTNPNGFVIQERYDDGTIGVNGETYREVKSKNTNFALLVTLRLTDPYLDVLELGKSIARMATKVGMGKPIIQRLGDLEKGRRSTWERIERSVITPTLKNVTPGDVGMILPYRVVTNLVEAMARLNVIYPGLYSPQTLIYAPEIKYYGVKAKVGKNLETNVEGIYVAGDGVGLSRGINVAAATGVLAARSIIESL